MKRVVVKNWRRYLFSRNRITVTVGVVALVLAGIESYAQAGGNGNAGISAAESQVKGYFTTATNLVYAIGAIVGLVGAVKVFNKWNSGDQDTGKVASAWFGSCIFLVVVATVLKGFFGV